ncbi:HNH endonuclease [Chloroflexota bacterium]
MISPGDVISYLDMCREEGVNLQRGMNFRLHGKFSIILMSLRVGAPYSDKIEENGKVLLYEGHDTPRRKSFPNPKMVDQPMLNPNGKLTQNGLFYQAATKYKNTRGQPEVVKVYEKIHSGIWVYNGLFKLIDASQKMNNARKVFKFKLEMMDDIEGINIEQREIDHSRLIPAMVKLEVWKRDKGRCVICESKDNLHFDHIIPYSKGGSSLVAENIQLLCARHNLAKRDKIE